MIMPVKVTLVKVTFADERNMVTPVMVINRNEKIASKHSRKIGAKMSANRWLPMPLVCHFSHKFCKIFV